MIKNKLLLFAFFLFLPSIVFADSSAFQTYMSGFYNYAITIGISLAILMTVYGGYKYMTSAGSSDATGEAKTIIVSALAGLALLVLANLIFKSLFPDLLNLP